MNENIKILGVGVVLVLLFFGICFSFLNQNFEIENQEYDYSQDMSVYQEHDYSQDMCMYQEHDYTQDMCPIDNNLYCPYYVFEWGF